MLLEIDQKRYSKLSPRVLFIIDPQTLLKIGSTNVTENWFHKRYSKLVSQTLLRIDSTNVTENWFHKRYSKLVPQTLLKIGFTNVTKLKKCFYQLRY